MLALDDPRWADLTHAYGGADDVPALLHALEADPTSSADPGRDVWESLWSSLCHQEDVYTASYAALPHLVRIAAATAGPVDFSFFHLPACIEVARAEGRGPALPAELAEAYRAGLAALPDAVVRHLAEPWDQSMMLSALSSLAAAKGHCDVAGAISRLDEDLIERLNRCDFDFD